MKTRHPLLATRIVMALALALPLTPLAARESPALGVVGITQSQLTADYWIARQTQADQPIMDRQAINAQNVRLMREDDSMHDLGATPDTLDGNQVRDWIENFAQLPQSSVYDGEGKPVDPARLQAIADNRWLDGIAASQATRFGMVVRRADLRAFPTTLRVFRSNDDTDIDRFQESAVFPGTPLVVAHESGDHQWWFVITPRYAAWIRKAFVAIGSRDEVLGYAGKAPYRIITGADVHTVFTREQPALSQLKLDMGVRVPVLADWPADTPVNGQHPYSSHVIELPVRLPDGSLAFAPALLQKHADSSADYLALTPANIIRQAFKFLGERYGWGHAYEGRDCSGFVAEVYRSMGVQMPRNTSDQGVSPAFAKRVFQEADDSAERSRAARESRVGDLVYIPGHVMLVIGSIDGDPWVIHDTTGISYHRADGSMARVPLNAVSVTPLMPLQFDDTHTYAERMRSIVHMPPAPATQTAGKP